MSPAATKSANKPSIILVCGAWHHPPHYTPLKSLLEAQGYPVETPANPSAGALASEDAFEKDVKNLRDLVRFMIEVEEKEVVLLMHSYGGSIGTFATEGLRKSVRDGSGGILAMVFMAAFALPEGVSTIEVGTQPVMPEWAFPDDEGYLRTKSEIEIFYHDLSTHDQEKWLKQLTTTPLAAFLTPGGPKPWKEYPTLYIYAELDRCIPIEKQRMMVEKMGVKVPTISLQSGHMPQLSMPEKVVEAVEEAVHLAGR